MATRTVWEINDGFETFPPDTSEHLFLEIEAPDFVVSHYMEYANKASDFRSLGINILDLDNYVDGQYVFVVHFTMEKDYPSTPTKSFKISTPAVMNTVSGTSFHILAFANAEKKKYKRSMTPITLMNL